MILKKAKCIQNKNCTCCEVKNTIDMIQNNHVSGQTDVVQDMINNKVKPSLMVQTQDGNQKILNILNFLCDIV